MSGWWGEDEPTALQEVLQQQEDTNHVRDSACLGSACWWSCQTIWPLSLVPKTDLFILLLLLVSFPLYYIR